VGSSSPRTASAAATARATLAALELEPEDPSPGGQFARVRNLTSRELDLGCWSLGSAATHRRMFVELHLRIPARGLAQLTPTRAWLAPTDRVTLRNRAGRVVERTPRLRDTAVDDRVWFRKPGRRWRFGRSPAETKPVAGDLVPNRPRGCRVLGSQGGQQ
jgi:hypothetical protein